MTTQKYPDIQYPYTKSVHFTTDVLVKPLCTTTVLYLYMNQNYPYTKSIHFATDILVKPLPSTTVLYLYMNQNYPYTKSIHLLAADVLEKPLCLHRVLDM